MDADQHIPHRPGEQSLAWPRGPLWGPLMAHMMRELGERTIDIERFRDWVETDAGLPPEDAHLSSSSRRAGWIIGALLAANGTDILCGRREREGLGQLLDEVRTLLAQRGLRLPKPHKQLALVEGGPNDWEIPWAVSNVLFLTGSEEGRSEFAWTFEGDSAGYTLWVQGSMGEALEAFLEDLQSRRLGVDFRFGANECLLNLSHGPNSST